MISPKFCVKLKFPRNYKIPKIFKEGNCLTLVNMFLKEIL